MDIETAWYELSPYFYIVVGAVAIYYLSESLAQLPGMLLIAAALTIVWVRWKHRRAKDAMVLRASDLMREAKDIDVGDSLTKTQKAGK